MLLGALVDNYVFVFASLWLYVHTYTVNMYSSSYYYYYCCH
jgi:hypothetical protein